MRRITLLAALCAAAAPAWAQDKDIVLKDHDLGERYFMSEWTRVEIAVGFHGGMRSYGRSAFTWKEGGPTGIGGLHAPFTDNPYADSGVVGPRFHTRVVAPPMRLTFGYQLPFAVYDAPQRARTYRYEGQDRRVVDESLVAHEIRFGLGLEYPGRIVAPFVDLVGDVHLVKASLSVDGEPVVFTSQSFSYAARVGLRAQVEEHIFVELAGEGGFVGPNRFGAQVLFGMAFY